MGLLRRTELEQELADAATAHPALHGPERRGARRNRRMEPGAPRQPQACASSAPRAGSRQVLEHELDTPIGVVASDWGGTPANWTSAQGLAPFPQFAKDLAECEKLASDPRTAEAVRTGSQGATGGCCEAGYVVGGPRRSRGLRRQQMDRDESSRHWTGDSRTDGIVWMRHDRGQRPGPDMNSSCRSGRSTTTSAPGSTANCSAPPMVGMSRAITRSPPRVSRARDDCRAHPGSEGGSAARPR